VEIGRGLLALFIPYIQHLIDEGLARKTVKSHGYHLKMLGGDQRTSLLPSPLKSPVPTMEACPVDSGSP